MEGDLSDYFRSFHIICKEKGLSASARSVYLALLGEFDAAPQAEELSLSDRHMLELSGVKSVSTVHDARNLLKAYKLIDFRKGHYRRTVYRLLSEPILEKVSAGTEHQEIDAQSNGLVKVAPPSPHPIPPKITDLSPTTTTPTPSSGACAIKYEQETNLNAFTTDASANIHDVWEYETGYSLPGSIAYALEQMANRDFEGVQAAIQTAVASNTRGRVSFNFFKKIYENSKKGDEKSERNGDPKYKLPDTSNDPF